MWSGAEAKKLGLVDELGGLDAAIRYAATRAGLGSKYRIQEFPRRKEFSEALQDALERMAPDSARAHATGLVAQVKAKIETELKLLQSFNDPAGMYALLPMNLEIR